LVQLPGLQNKQNEKEL